MSEELTEKIKAAPESSREIDRDIAFAIDWYPPNIQDIGCYFEDAAMGCTGGEIYAPPRFTESLDEARTLLPEGFAYTIDAAVGCPAIAVTRGGGRMHVFRHPIPAMAFCGAALMARFGEVQ